MNSGDLLDQFDQLVGSVVAPTYVPYGAQVLPAPMTATYEETRAAQGATYTVMLTRDAETCIERRREARDAAVGRVVDIYRAEAKAGKPGAWDRRCSALAAIPETVPDRVQALERAAIDVAVAGQDYHDRVLTEMRNLFPDTATTKG